VRVIPPAEGCRCEVHDSLVPAPDPRQRRQRTLLKGETPNPIDLPSGCRFHTRCPRAFDQCPQTEPVLSSVGRDHQAARLLVHSAGGRLTDAQPEEVP
jgi:oligopeptide/dipeptide ABC transporter ATP-binding protein